MQGSSQQCDVVVGNDLLDPEESKARLSGDKQACDVHVARGGQHPLGGDIAIGTQEEVVVQMPLLRGEVGAATATPDQGAHEVADERVGEHRRPPSLEAGLAIAIDAGTLPSRELALAEEVPFEEPVSA